MTSKAKMKDVIAALDGQVFKQLMSARLECFILMVDNIISILWIDAFQFTLFISESCLNSLWYVDIISFYNEVY